MSAEDRVSKQTSRLYFHERDHVGLYGNFSHDINHIRDYNNTYYYRGPRYFQTAFMKDAYKSKRGIVYRKYFPDDAIVLPYDSSTVQYYDMGVIIAYPKLGCWTGGGGTIRYTDRNIRGLDPVSVDLAGKYQIFSRSESYANPGSSELVITIEDGRTRLTYKPKLYMGTKWLGYEYTEGIIGFKDGLIHTPSDYQTSGTPVHWVCMKFNSKKDLDPYNDEIITSEVDCGLRADILRYSQQQITWDGKITYYDAEYTMYSDFRSPNFLLVESQTYSDRNRIYFRTMSPTGGKSGRLGFLQTARGSDSPVLCSYVSILDACYCNGRWVIAVYHESTRGPGTVGTGHYIGIYALNSGGLQKLHETHILSYRDSAECRIMYAKGTYYVYMTAMQNLQPGNTPRTFVRIYYGSALSHLSEYIPSGIRTVPIHRANGEVDSDVFHFIMNGEDPNDYDRSDPDQEYVVFGAHHVNRIRTHTQYRDNKMCEPNWLVTNGPWTEGWWNHGGYCIFKDFFMHDSDENWGFYEVWGSGPSDQYIWQAYYEE